MRHPALASSDRACLVVVDVQDKLLPIVQDRDAVVDNVRRLVRGCRLLGVPVVHTEQYPRGLGRTVGPLREVLGEEAAPVEKTTFSCFQDAGFRDRLGAVDRSQLLVCGIETHICVAQTAFDALAAGYEVQVVADATGTRMPQAREIGLRRLDRAGVDLTTTEAVLFELLERSDAAAFKAVQDLIR